MNEPLAADKQVTLSAFYLMAQLRQGIQDPQEMVGQWPEKIVTEITKTVEQRVRAKLLGKEIPSLLFLPSGAPRSNQSKGNIAAKYVALHIQEGAQLKTGKLKGSGYPDNYLQYQGGFICCLEFKATSQWNENDGNRRVLTSSTSKMVIAIDSKSLPARPCHLLATIIYNDETGVLNGLRLDFLQPDSLVNVRLEASTSHNLLHSGGHVTIEIA